MENMFLRWSGCGAFEVRLGDVNVAFDPYLFGENLLQFLDWVRPRYMIPIHYRTDRASEPVPAGHWPPDVTDVAAFIEWIRETVGERTQVLPFTAGIEYEVEMPSRHVLWKWNWRKSWTVGLWREG